MRSELRAAPDASTPADAGGAAVAKLADFIATAIAMELEAAHRYDEFANAMERRGKREAAALFRELADHEARHADELLAQMGWTAVPLVPRVSFEASSGPETAGMDALRDVETPRDALLIALANEVRAEQFFARLAEVVADDAVRRAARSMQTEEREHAGLVRAWLGTLGASEATDQHPRPVPGSG